MGFQGRDWFARTCAVVFLAFVLPSAAIGAQSAVSYGDVASDLAAKIAAALTDAGSAAIEPIDEDPGNAQIQRDVARTLDARGVRIVPPDAGPATIVRIGCGSSLRERACVAGISRGGAVDIITAAAPTAVRLPDDPGGGHLPLAIEATPIFGQRVQILDVGLVDDRLIVLDPAALTVYRRAGLGWERMESRAIAAERPWPRDVRGRLRVSAGSVDVFLPGMLCKAPVDVASLSCVEQREPWPVAVANAGLDGVRNAFHTPEGLAFYSAASLGADAEAAAAVVDSTGTIVLIGDSHAAIGRVGAADDVAGLSVGCRNGAFMLASSGVPGAAGDTLRLWQIVGRRAIPAATPLAFPGRLTALWSAEGAAAATAIVHDADAGRYEAFQIRAACDR